MPPAPREGSAGGLLLTASALRGSGRLSDVELRLELGDLLLDLLLALLPALLVKLPSRLLLRGAVGFLGNGDLRLHVVERLPGHRAAQPRERRVQDLVALLVHLGQDRGTAGANDA